MKFYKLRFLFVIAVSLHSAAKELHEGIHVEIITARLDQRLAVAALKNIIWLGIDAVCLQCII